jgi:hypothetical protein
MSELDEVIDGLRTMGLLQLLLAFTACIAYVLVQGSLLGRTGRRVAWIGALGGAGAFVAMSQAWTNAVVLVAAAIVGLGFFNALVWLTSRAIGVDRQVLPEAPVAETVSPVAAPAEAARPPVVGHTVSA